MENAMNEQKVAIKVSRETRDELNVLVALRSQATKTTLTLDDILVLLLYTYAKAKDDAKNG